MIPARQIADQLKAKKLPAGGWIARCKSHPDASPSLKIAEGDDGRPMLHCYAGCDFERIVASLGYQVADMLPPTGNGHDKGRETVYSLKLPDGSTVEHVRTDYPDSSKRFSWQRCGKPGLGGIKVEDLPLYIPSQVKHPGTPVVLCEGEKSATAAVSLGLTAVGTVTGASSAPSVTVLEILRDRDVILWADNDEPGRKHMASIATRLTGIAKTVKLVSWGTKIGDDAGDFSGDIQTLLESAIFPEQVTPAGILPLWTRAGSALKRLDRFQTNDQTDTLPTGLPELDRRLMGGFQKGTLTLIGAETGNGKTTLAQHFAFTASSRGPVLFVSPEMDPDMLAEREIVRRAQVSKWDRAPWLRKGELGSERDTRQRMALEAHVAAFTRLTTEKPPVHVLDLLDATMPAIHEAAESLAKGPGLSLVVLDYAQQLADDDPRKARYLTVGAVAQEGVILARRLNIPVIVTSQVNSVKLKDGSREYSFRESGILEHKAHLSMLFEVKWTEDADESLDPADKRRVEWAKLTSRKVRDGPPFVVRLAYKPACYWIGPENDGIEFGYV